MQNGGPSKEEFEGRWRAISKRTRSNQHLLQFLCYSHVVPGMQELAAMRLDQALKISVYS
ncbi:uncharacterized protein METZ01_LOCUS304299 [marine metagenome]|uniref:Uncharacterized protein n=1 Tax=marine metagenome TaxID=408172 RepID=A0A382MTL3_9ZZZZ